MGGIDIYMRALPCQVDRGASRHRTTHFKEIYMATIGAGVLAGTSNMAVPIYGPGCRTTRLPGVRRGVRD